MKQVDISAAASEDLRIATSFYSEESQRLASAFLEEFDHICSIVSELPEIGSPVGDGIQKDGDAQISVHCNLQESSRAHSHPDGRTSTSAPGLLAETQIVFGNVPEMPCTGIIDFTIAFEHDVLIEGQRLAAGTYGRQSAGLSGCDRITSIQLSDLDVRRSSQIPHRPLPFCSCRIMGHSVR